MGIAVPDGVHSCSNSTPHSHLYFIHPPLVLSGPGTGHPYEPDYHHFTVIDCLLQWPAYRDRRGLLSKWVLAGDGHIGHLFPYGFPILGRQTPRYARIPTMILRALLIDPPTVCGSLPAIRHGWFAAGAVLPYGVGSVASRLWVHAHTF